MKSKNILTVILFFLAYASHAQTENRILTHSNSNGFAQTDQSERNRKYSISAGIGYFSPLLSDDKVSFPDAEYSPEIGLGISYFISLDYSLSKDLYVGVGFNGNYGKAKFIKNATINGQQINGYLEAGALENSHFLLNVTYSPAKDGLRPFAKFGIGYFKAELELGDIPLELTGNVEKELFPDYKSQGLGILPEIGLSYKLFTLSAAYGLPIDKLTGEKGSEPGAYTSAGTIKSHSLQINAAYRIFLFKGVNRQHKVD